MHLHYVAQNHNFILLGSTSTIIFKLVPLKLILVEDGHSGPSKLLLYGHDFSNELSSLLRFSPHFKACYGKWFLM